MTRYFSSYGVAVGVWVGSGGAVTVEVGGSAVGGGEVGGAEVGGCGVEVSVGPLTGAGWVAVGVSPPGALVVVVGVPLG